MTLSYELKHFDQLTLRELYAIMKLRQEVFVVEQDCPYLDADDVDLSCYHFLGLDANGVLQAYTRIIDKGVSYPEFASIGRVIVHPRARKYGLGKELMNKSVAACKKLFAGAPIKIGGQVYLLKFYTELGFQTVGDEYLEDGIPHVCMVYNAK